MKRHAPRVCIQIVTYNSSGSIVQCLRSVLRQTVPCRIIVIDNNSSDTTVRLVKKLGVRCLELFQNVGYAGAHNIGLQNGVGEYVMTVNPDVALSPTCVEQLIQHMDAMEIAGSAQPLLLRVDHLGEKSTTVDSSGLSMRPSRQQVLRYEEKPLSLAGDAPVSIFGPDGAAAFYRRSMLLDIDLGHGVFDEDYFMHKEDVDVSWRAQLRGWMSIVVPTAIGYHVRSFRAGKRDRVDKKMRMLAVRNRYYLILKNELPGLFLRDALWIILYDVGIALYVLVFERSSIQAYIQLIRGVRRLLAKRRLIQRTKRVHASCMAKWFSWRYV